MRNLSADFLAQNGVLQRNTLPSANAANQARFREETGRRIFRPTEDAASANIASRYRQELNHLRFAARQVGRERAVSQVAEVGLKELQGTLAKMRDLVGKVGSVGTEEEFVALQTQFDTLKQGVSEIFASARAYGESVLEEMEGFPGMRDQIMGIDLRNLEGALKDSWTTNSADLTILRTSTTLAPGTYQIELTRLPDAPPASPGETAPESPAPEDGRKGGRGTEQRSDMADWAHSKAPGQVKRNPPVEPGENPSGPEGTPRYEVTIGGYAATFDVETGEIRGVEGTPVEGLVLQYSGSATGTIGSVTLERGLVPSAAVIDQAIAKVSEETTLTAVRSGNLAAQEVELQVRMQATSRGVETLEGIDPAEAKAEALRESLKSDQALAMRAQASVAPAQIMSLLIDQLPQIKHERKEDSESAERLDQSREAGRKIEVVAAPVVREPDVQARLGERRDRSEPLSRTATSLSE